MSDTVNVIAGLTLMLVGTIGAFAPAAYAAIWARPIRPAFLTSSLLRLPLRLMGLTFLFYGLVAVVRAMSRGEVALLFAHNLSRVVFGLLLLTLIASVVTSFLLRRVPGADLLERARDERAARRRMAYETIVTGVFAGIVFVGVIVFSIRG